MTKPEEAAAAAIQKAGGGAVLARALGITMPAITHWKRRGIPAERVQAVSRLTGIPLHELRPDLFDPPQRVEAA